MSGLYDELLIAFHGIWNRRWLALATAWGICMLGWLVVALIPNSYESKAKVYVEAQSILPNKMGVSPIEQQQDVDRVRQTLTSAANLEKIVRTTDLAQTVTTDREIAGKVGMLRQKIKIVTDQDNLFDISVSLSDSSLSDGGNARVANQVAQKLVELFQQADILNDRLRRTSAHHDAVQLKASKPGTVSATVGMSGSKDVRLAVVAPSDRSAPDVR